MNKILLAVMLVVATGCVPVYTKTGVTPAQQTKDEEACWAKMEDRFHWAMRGDASLAYYWRCLEENGYQLVKAPPAAPVAFPRSR